MENLLDNYNELNEFAKNNSRATTWDFIKGFLYTAVPIAVIILTLLWIGGDL